MSYVHLLDPDSIKKALPPRMRQSPHDWIVIRHNLTEQLYRHPYDLSLYIDRAKAYAQLGYPDLAASDAYRALLLTDEIRDETGEYHEEASLALEGRCHEGAGFDENEKLSKALDKETLRCYQVLASNLTDCGCLKTAWDFCNRGLAVYADDTRLLRERDKIRRQGKLLLHKQSGDILVPRDIDHVADSTGDIHPNDLPDQGSARREVYPWNTYEPERFSQESLDSLNSEMAKVAPKLEVKATFLPSLQGTSRLPRKQLGVFAKEPLLPGETILRETSILAVNNRLHDSLCDACSTRLPSTQPETLQIVPCPDCEDTYFCNTECLQRAMETYHPAVCGLDMEAVGKEVKKKETPEALYLLLLARVFAMAETMAVHPLELKEVKYIWGDFTENVDELVWKKINSTSTLEEVSTLYPTFPTTLPFTFHQNISLPLHLLQKMSLNPYLNLSTYDTWIYNTLFSKFRGTASARISQSDYTPEVSAVHPMWCLANHDCNPNVQWEWGGEIRFWVRERRVGGGEGGVGKGEEIKGHYCDIDLRVSERREWAVGSLGGLCMCERCMREAEAETAGG